MPTPDFKLPLLGLATCYYEFSKEDPDAGVRRHRGDLRRLLEMELKMSRCDFDALKGYYNELDMKGPLYLAGVTNCVVGALGRGDLRLFTRILRDLEHYPNVNPHPQAKFGRDITLAWIRQFIKVGRGYPEWMERVDLTQIPEEWKRQCAFLGVRRMMLRKEYVAAYAAATMLLNFDSRKDLLSAVSVYERLACASACYELGRKEEAFDWFRQTVEMTCRHGIFLPYLLLVARFGPVMEAVIREVAPAAVDRIRRLAVKFFRNLVCFHNSFSGENAATDLTPQEFYLAQQLVDGCSYKEIAAKLDISSGRVNKVVSLIYSKLGVHSKSKLREFVW